MATPIRPQVILGGGPFGGTKLPTASSVKEWTDLFHNTHGHARIDSAAGYPPEKPGASESALAESGATAWATIDTKVYSIGAGAHARERVLRSIENSLKRLGFLDDGGEGTGRAQVDVMYLHVPCLDTPLEETAGAMQEAYQRGWFRRFGLSNYTPWHVEELCETAKKNGWVQPTVSLEAVSWVRTGVQ